MTRALIAAFQRQVSHNQHLGPRPFFLGGSSSGRTADSDSVNLGSNPSPPAISARRTKAGFAPAFVCLGEGPSAEGRGERPRISARRQARNTPRHQSPPSATTAASAEPPILGPRPSALPLHQPIDRRQKGRQRLAAARGRCDKHITASRDDGPPGGLGVGGAGKVLAKPAVGGGAEDVHGGEMGAQGGESDGGGLDLIRARPSPSRPCPPTSGTSAGRRSSTRLINSF